MRRVLRLHPLNGNQNGSRRVAVKVMQLYASERPVLALLNREPLRVTFAGRVQFARTDI
jgi:hypothetical protein